MDALRAHPEISGCCNFMLPAELSAVTSETSTALQKAHARFCSKTRLYRALFSVLLLLVGLFFVLRPSGIFLSNVASEDYLRERGWKQSYEEEERARLIQREMERIQAELDQVESGGAFDTKALTTSMKLLGSMIVGPGTVLALDTAAGMVSGHAQPEEKPEVNVESEQLQIERLREELDRQERAHENELRRLGTPSHAVLLPLILYGAMLAALGGWSLGGLTNTSYAGAVSYSLFALCVCASQLLALGLAGLVLPAADEAEGVTINQSYVQWTTVVTGLVGLAWFANYFEAKSISGFEAAKPGDNV